MPAYRRHLHRPAALLLASLIPLGLCFAADPPHKQQPDLQWGVKIPLRDGVRLNATIYRPHEQKDPLPVIFTLTPYIGDTYLERATYFSQSGYVYALVDVRGRGNSEGSFEPFANEGRDGYDVVEWLAKQPWCNGKVAMWGGSYAGFDQWSTLKEFPPHLSTIVPAAAAHPAVDFPFDHGVFTSYIIQWLTYTSGVTGNVNTFGNSDYWKSKFTDLYLKHLPFQELDRVVGNTTTVFHKWLDHPTADAYWNAMAPTAEDYKKITIPILTITGHYDGDQTGAMTYYRRHMQYGSESAKARHYLIVGPWDHAGTRTPRREVGGLMFADTSLVDLNRLHKQWYDWTMKDGPKPDFLKDRVSYFVAGEDVWKHAGSLDALAPKVQKLYLSSTGGRANDVFESGKLTNSEPAQKEPDRFTYDPLDIRPAALHKKDNPNGLTDQTDVLNLFGNGLIYHSDAFPADTEVTGYVKFVAWIAMDVPDTDFAVELDEIKADGTSVQLTADIMRARYRDSLTQEKLAKAGEVNRYEFNGFTFFSRKVAKGSRLRLFLSCPNSIQLEKNYNSGGIVAAESAKDARTAHITVYHEPGRGSFLEIPVIQ